MIGFDLETSGLNEQSDQILELYARPGRIIDGRFEAHQIGLEGGVSFVFPISTDVAAWHPAVVEMHVKNGLLAEAHAKGPELAKLLGGFTPAQRAQRALEEADETLCGIFPKLEGKASWILLGNSVHFDLRFARRCFPKFAKRLSHRVIDVSAIRIFTEALGLAYVKDEPAHRAAEDVDYSVGAFERYHAWAARA